jgi:hypothetical protein
MWFFNNAVILFACRKSYPSPPFFFLITFRLSLIGDGRSKPKGEGFCRGYFIIIVMNGTIQKHRVEYLYSNIYKVVL